MTRHLSDNFPPPLSSESRPEGHPYEGHRTNKTAVGRTILKNPFPQVKNSHHRCRQNKNQYKHHRKNPPTTVRRTKELPPLDKKAPACYTVHIRLYRKGRCFSCVNPFSLPCCPCYWHFCLFSFSPASHSPLPCSTTTPFWEN